MEPVKNTKRIVSVLVPYRARPDGEIEFYLQMRDANAKSAPSKFGIFGGGLEDNETPEDGLLREIKEELVYTPKNYIYFSRYEHASHIHHVYIEEVRPDFENNIEVREGEYGIF